MLYPLYTNLNEEKKVDDKLIWGTYILWSYEGAIAMREPLHAGKFHWGSPVEKDAA